MSPLAVFFFLLLAAALPLPPINGFNPRNVEEIIQNKCAECQRSPPPPKECPPKPPPSPPPPYCPPLPRNCTRSTTLWTARKTGSPPWDYYHW
nr:leucine-rich repeat extensin-like protein 3 [Ipomoea batatas]